MQVKLRRIDPFQAGKMLAALYGAMSLIFVPFMILFMALGSMAGRAQGPGAPSGFALLGMGIGFMVLLPLFYTVAGFLFGLIGAAIYNLLAKWVGGFEFEFETPSPPPPPS